MQIDYTARRSIKAGHSVDTPYTIVVDLSRLDRKYATVGNQAVALSGTTYTTVHRREVLFDLQTTLIESSGTPDIADMLEFLDSVSSGESFSLDVSGTTETYVLTSITRPYSTTRVGYDDIYRYSFSVRKL